METKQIKNLSNDSEMNMLLKSILKITINGIILYEKKRSNKSMKRVSIKKN